MGTWPLWIGFNAAAAVLLLLDLALFQRRPHAVSLREAAIESAGWIALSIAFGAWIYSSHGAGPGLEFFAGYLVEKSLSLDNLFVFLLVFRYFRVDSRYQHRLLLWGVLGALVLRGALIAAGAVLISRFSWILYILGAFLLYSGFHLFGADHAVHPEKNPLVNWARKFLPIADAGASPSLLVRQGGRWVFTSLFLVVLVLETTDIVLAIDSVAAVFGVTRDPFLVYTSNVCAILGLRALYFLLAGVLQYFRYLDEGLAVAVMFIGAKLLVEPWVHISTVVSLAVVGGIVSTAILVSVIRAKPGGNAAQPKVVRRGRLVPVEVTPERIARLADSDPANRTRAARDLFNAGLSRALDAFQDWEQDEELRALMVREKDDGAALAEYFSARVTVGIAVLPETFDRIRAANGAPQLADAPADQDVVEFELDFPEAGMPRVLLDLLTTKAPGGNGAIARFLEKFGEGIQQVEMDVMDVDHATGILRARFKIEPIYPATRPGANGTRVNFFLVPTRDNKKVLVELVEQPKRATRSRVTSD